MMSSQDDASIKKIQSTIQVSVDELEAIIRHTKLLESDGKPDHTVLQHIIQGHYVEIIHHLNQIKHHIQQINYHKKSLDDIEKQFSVFDKHADDANEEDSVKKNESDAINKRPEEEKLRFKNRRVTRTSSLKYVLQWEKMLDEQKEDNPLNSVKRRWKSEDILAVNTAQSDMSSTIVRNRIQKFEGITKPKRMSSTIEGFLEISGTKPHEVRSLPIPEDVEACSDLESRSSSISEERHDEKICEKASKDSSLNFQDSGLIGKPDILDAIVQKVYDASRDGEEKKQNLLELPEESPKQTNVSESSDLSNEIDDLPNREQVTPEEDYCDEGLDEDSTVKPRIVEVHYKQTSPTDVITEIPLI